jgi:hypothetical protein
MRHAHNIGGSKLLDAIAGAVLCRRLWPLTVIQYRIGDVIKFAAADFVLPAMAALAEIEKHSGSMTKKSRLAGRRHSNQAELLAAPAHHGEPSQADADQQRRPGLGNLLPS